ncbi:MAG TPA: hypothetical protein DEH78_26990 [Solibacterales bacterium]|nr:hypothetical protein [Bryobacterales bacterium]
MLVAVILPALLGAATITYVIRDLGTFPDYTSNDLAATYTGTGYVGLYGPSGGASFVHLFGLEDAGYSMALLQVNISALIGQTIQSAILSFVTLDGQGAQSVKATSFDADGTLGYYVSAPSDLGSAYFNTAVQANQSFNVTSLVAARVGTGSTWFGLHLAGENVEYPYTYSFDFDNNVPDPDRALVRLVVETSEIVSLPEPGGAVLIGAGLAAFGLARRRGRS